MKNLLYISIVVLVQGCAIALKSDKSEKYIGKEVYIRTHYFHDGYKSEVLKYDLDKMKLAQRCQKYKIHDILDNTIRGETVVILDGEKGQSYFFISKSSNIDKYITSENVCKIESEKYEAENQQRENERVSKIESFVRKYPQYKKYGKVAMDRQIQIGMPEPLLILSWGVAEDVNETVTRYGVHKQHVYGKQYVYTENGFITSWQK